MESMEWKADREAIPPPMAVARRMSMTWGEKRKKARQEKPYQNKQNIPLGRSFRGTS